MKLDPLVVSNGSEICNKPPTDIFEDVKEPERILDGDVVQQRRPQNRKHVQPTHNGEFRHRTYDNNCVYQPSDVLD